MSLLSIIKKAYQVVLFILLCWGGHAWFTWEWDNMGLGRFGLFFIFLLITLIYQQFYKISLRFSGIVKLLFALWCTASLFPDFKFVSPLIEACRLFPILILFNDRKHITEHFIFLCKALALLLVPGIILWMVITVGEVYIPVNPIEMGDSGNDNYYFSNYYVLLDRIMVPSNRFQSIFLEPGYLGTMLAFLLYAAKYRMKNWYNIVMLIGLLCTQSLAGYVVSFVGFIILKSINGFSIKKYICIFLMGIVAIFIVQSYNNGDNYVNKNIIERITDEDSDKSIKADHLRVSYQTDVLFKESISNCNIIFGLGDNKRINGAGYKVFFLRFGLLAALLYFFVYFYISKMSSSKRYGVFFLILVIMTFYQAAYPYSYSWIIPFVFGILLDKNCKTQMY